MELREVSGSQEGLVQLLVQCLEDAQEQLAAGAGGEQDSSRLRHQAGGQARPVPGEVPSQDALPGAPCVASRAAAWQ
jgi:hypothetical protein